MRPKFMASAEWFEYKEWWLRPLYTTIQEWEATPSPVEISAPRGWRDDDGMALLLYKRKNPGHLSRGMRFYKVVGILPDGTRTRIPLWGISDFNISMSQRETLKRWFDMEALRNHQLMEESGLYLFYLVVDSLMAPHVGVDYKINQLRDLSLSTKKEWWENVIDCLYMQVYGLPDQMPVYMEQAQEIITRLVFEGGK